MRKRRETKDEKRRRNEKEKRFCRERQDQKGKPFFEILILFQSDLLEIISD